MPRTVYLDAADDQFDTLRKQTEDQLSAEGGRMVIKEKQTYDDPKTGEKKHMQSEYGFPGGNRVRK